MPFLALLRAAISDPSDQQDTKLLSDVVTSLEAAVKQAPGAEKLYQICRILYQTALRIIDEGWRIGSFHVGTDSTQLYSEDVHIEPPDHSQQTCYNNASEQQSLNSLSSFNGDMTAFTASANAQSTLSVSDDAKEMSVWFEDFFGGNTSMLDILESDHAQLDWNRL